MTRLSWPKVLAASCCQPWVLAKVFTGHWKPSLGCTGYGRALCIFENEGRCGPEKVLCHREAGLRAMWVAEAPQSVPFRGQRSGSEWKNLKAPHWPHSTENLGECLEGLRATALPSGPAAQWYGHMVQAQCPMATDRVPWRVYYSVTPVSILARLGEFPRPPLLLSSQRPRPGRCSVPVGWGQGWPLGCSVR